jgi:hypothetical protein
LRACDLTGAMLAVQLKRTTATPRMKSGERFTAD